MLSAGNKFFSSFMVLEGLCLQQNNSHVGYRLKLSVKNIKRPGQTMIWVNYPVCSLRFTQIMFVYFQEQCEQSH